MNTTVKRIIGAATIGLAALSLAGCSAEYEGDVTGCEVTDKQAIGRSDGDGGSATDYRVFTSCGVFAVQDDPFLGQWNSADTYGSIQIGHTYDFEAYGWRNGFMSTFPNITNATEVE